MQNAWNDPEKKHFPNVFRIAEECRRSGLSPYLYVWKWTIEGVTKHAEVFIG